MTAPMNLTLKPGPSVWDDRRSAPIDWRVAAATSGLLLTAIGLSSRSGRNQWLVSLGLCGVALSLFGSQFSSAWQVGSRALRGSQRATDDHAIDRASEASFPASDPPAIR